MRVKGLEDLTIVNWQKGGLDGNLNSNGKTGVGELNWGTEELLDPTVAEDAEKEFAQEIDPEEEGENLHCYDIEPKMSVRILEE